MPDGTGAYRAYIMMLCGATHGQVIHLQRRLAHAHRQGWYWFFLLLTFASLAGIVSTPDMAAMYGYWELMTFASYFLVVHEANRVAFDAGFKYYLMCAGGALLMLPGMLLLGNGGLGLADVRIQSALLSPHVLNMAALLCLVGFGVKAGLLLAAVVLLFTFTRDSALSVSESIIIMLVFVGFMVESILAAKREQGSEATDERPSTDGKSVAINIGKFVLGAAAIVLGAQLLIDNGSALAVMIGVPDSVIAATMIAIGTSLPELVTTITAIRKKQSSLSVGNIIGANIMDLTLIMPLCALLQGKPLAVENQGMLLDVPACLVVSAAAMIPALVCGKFKRWIGVLIGVLYIAYLVVMFTYFGA